MSDLAKRNQLSDAQGAVTNVDVLVVLKHDGIVRSFEGKARRVTFEADMDVHYNTWDRQLFCDPLERKMTIEYDYDDIVERMVVG